MVERSNYNVIRPRLMSVLFPINDLKFISLIVKTVQLAVHFMHC
ncbi:MAG: hypothetical protein FKGGLIKP_00596 [Sodalis sp. Fse]|nr:MAG: hypothetical protein FKGGLIKP_00596 [Sodalis sp. Fse]UVK79393.1 MAG: hypothetical protein IGNPGNKH_00889 [Sodalis sp. Ffu]